ncbi:hypothetical protein JCM16418A_15100 [Paenibacillus pini]
MKYNLSKEKINCYQQDLLSMLFRMPSGYLSEVLPKKPSNEILAVIEIYNRHLVSSK